MKNQNRMANSVDPGLAVSSESTLFAKQWAERVNREKSQMFYDHIHTFHVV